MKRIIRTTLAMIIKCLLTIVLAILATLYIMIKNMLIPLFRLFNNNKIIDIILKPLAKIFSPVVPSLVSVWVLQDRIYIIAREIEEGNTNIEIDIFLICIASFMIFIMWYILTELFYRIYYNYKNNGHADNEIVSAIYKLQKSAYSYALTFISLAALVSAVIDSPIIAEEINWSILAIGIYVVLLLIVTELYEHLIFDKGISEMAYDKYSEWYEKIETMSHDFMKKED